MKCGPQASSVPMCCSIRLVKSTARVARLSPSTHLLRGEGILAAGDGLDDQRRPCTQTLQLARRLPLLILPANSTVRSIHLQSTACDIRLGSLSNAISKSHEICRPRLTSSVPVPMMRCTSALPWPLRMAVIISFSCTVGPAA